MSEAEETYDDRPARMISSHDSSDEAMLELRRREKDHRQRCVTDLACGRARGNARRVEHLPLDAVVVPDALRHRVKRLARLEVEADDVALGLLVLERDERVLNVPAAIGSERLGQDQERLGKGRDAELGPALGEPLRLAQEVGRARDLESARAGDERLVLDRVLDGTQAVPDRIVRLAHAVRVGACVEGWQQSQAEGGWSGGWHEASDTSLRAGRTLDEQRHRLGLPALLDERKFLLSERVLVDEAGIAETLGLEVVDRVLGGAAAAKLEALHVAALSPAKRKDAVLDEDVERHRVNTLLVDDDKRPRLLLRVDVLVADEVLELDNLLQLGVDKAALRLDQLLALLGRRVEERRVDLTERAARARGRRSEGSAGQLQRAVVGRAPKGADARLLVLERYVERQDEAVLEPLGHVWVPGAVIHDETADERGLGVHLVLHLHNLDHVQVDWVLERVDADGVGGRCWRLDGQDGVDDKAGDLGRQLRVDLGRERGVGHRDERRPVERRLLDLERVKELAQAGRAGRQRACPPSTGNQRRRTFSASLAATSKPSPNTRGCTPSDVYRSACFRSSPASRTTEVVPSPVCSSCATAVRAIMAAVGFYAQAGGSSQPGSNSDTSSQSNQTHLDLHLGEENLAVLEEAKREGASGSKGGRWSESLSPSDAASPSPLQGRDDKPWSS